MRRKLETFYTHSPHITEFFNTISNLPFILFGLTHLIEGTRIPGFYTLMILCGVCSGIHHARDFPYSIVLDWTPITLSLYGIWYYKVYACLTWVTFVKLLLAGFILVTDHIWTPITVPFGHVLWHVSASLVLDSLYIEYETSLAAMLVFGA